MAIIQLQWDVPTLAALLADGFNQQKIEVENTPATWTEATRPTTRLPLVAYCERYVWELASSEALQFRMVPHRSADNTDGTPVSVTTVKKRGYCTVQDIRAEGYTNEMLYPDAAIEAKIDYATAMIDRICGQRFDPFYAVYSFDLKRNYPEYHLDIPIIALLKAEETMLSKDAGEISLDSIVVYNRHLTQGMFNPDDRRNPMIGFADDVTPVSRRLNGVGRFASGRRVLTLYGIWGFTELGPVDIAGETALNSQFPLSLGQTPAEIVRATKLLTAAYLPPIADGGAEEAVNASRIIGESTRDQSISLDRGSVKEDSAYGFTGIQEVDTILMRYCGPAKIGSI